MEHKLSHQQRLLQKMSLTPQMRLSIKLLGMSVKDLGEYIDSAVANNPFLKKLVEEKGHRPYQKDGPSLVLSGDSGQYPTDTKSEIEPRLNLLSQAKMAGLEGKALEIAEYLIYEIDENGYIPIDSEEAARDLSTSVEEVEDILNAIQAMEPAGIGSRDVRECLQLQLKRKDKEGSLEYVIITSFLNELARNDIETISKALKVDKEKVHAAINNIKKLNPKPASTMLSKEMEEVMPELIAKVDNKKVRLELNRGVLPQLKLYNPYEKDLDIIKDPEARKFMKENIDFAKSLLDNLRRRETTICDVANYILNFQKAALLKGGYKLKSLTIKDVANALDFHPSTISRAVSNKFIQVNDKVIPLASLLSHGIRKENGETESKTAVKNRIMELVKNEDRLYPLSDSEIEAKLKEEGIKVARRTVVKYRTALKILPTYLRKKVKPA